MRKLTILGIILLIITTATYLFYQEGSLPVNKNDDTAEIFVIGQGESLNMIINNLAKARLIRNRLVFFLILKQKGLDRNIQAGSFRLQPSFDAYQLADALTHGTLDVWVTIPEGLRREEVAEIFSQKLGITEVEFNEQAQEGYLFPDTYLIPQNASAQDVIKIMTNNFNSKFQAEMKAQAQKLGLTEGQVVTLASIVEREAKFDQDRKIVAGILVRRLREDIPLQVDATIQYILGYQSTEKRWWKTHLSVNDLKINSFYNTYKQIGLPPGPISNPGLSALEAVVNANPNTPYLFYLSEPSGKTHYATTLDEHEENISKYLR
ncbi:hypothetical protein A2966_01015 [Candidatus Roizmanbacteria bacterium RIFCSPLOWO2_01_FULL_41_22]|uniref:Endolytic murein transglycosylase n=2 Tax=Candidatus Roizmaniibacteriota TaxID=1752723 RepID=A0A1F7JQW9_9BACT|nr:MAG: hypothetical protein A2966_01015 [Candidatus Roizmanbacteria bacterium RIFCSPLOWO2_01_FULL_41_22]OGK57995.1 MAG: hypothetical protein A3H86_03730 [Candidatus Roizmanbacteria bacterium RIFCSPLOWO2_02_FULL_41_9]